MNRNKGFSLPSVIVGTIISAVIVAGGMSHLVGIYSDSKEMVLASHIKKQKRVLEAHAFTNFEQIKDANDPLSGGDVNEVDFLKDSIEKGYFDELPMEVFDDESALTWEIRMLMDGNSELFYVFIESSNIADQETIEGAIEILHLPPSMMLVQ